MVIRSTQYPWQVLFRSAMLRTMVSPKQSRNVHFSGSNAHILQTYPTSWKRFRGIRYVAMKTGVNESIVDDSGIQNPFQSLEISSPISGRTAVKELFSQFPDISESAVVIGRPQTAVDDGPVFEVVLHRVKGFGIHSGFQPSLPFIYRRNLFLTCYYCCFCNVQNLAFTQGWAHGWWGGTTILNFELTPPS